MEDDDTFLLSFADALTCVFGAAVALFMIFVVLVKLAPVDPGPAEEIADSSSVGAAVNMLVSQGGGDAILQVEGPSCSDVESLAVPDADQSWVVRHEAPDGSDLCARVFEIPANRIASASGAILQTDTILGDELKFRLIVGATVWPKSAALRFRGPLDCQIVGDLARITQDSTMPIEILEQCS